MTRRGAVLAGLALAAGIAAWVAAGPGGPAVPDRGRGGGAGADGTPPLLPGWPDAPDDAPPPAVEESGAAGPLLRGVVVDGDGAPVPGAEVAASVDGDPRPRRTTSGPGGEFVLAGFGAGEDLLLGARAPGLAPALIGGARAGGDPVRLVLRPPARLGGRVLSPGGEPRPGARVRVTLRFPGVAKPLGGLETRADEEGAFLLTGLPAVAGSAEADWREAASGPRDFDLEASGGEALLDLVVDEGPTIAGRVRDAAGAPVPGIRVRARKASGSVVVAETGEDGTFTLRGAGEGPCTVSACDLLGRYLDADPLEDVLPPRSGLDLVVAANPDAPGRYRFRCLDPGGEPLAEVVTEEAMIDGADSGRTSRAAGADGSFLSGNLAAGRWSSVLRSPRGVARTEFTVGRGAVTDLGTIRLSPAAAVRLRAVDPGGAPLEGVLVLAGDATHREPPDRGDPARFRIEGLPAGAGTVRLLHGRYEAREIPWRAGPGETADLGDVVMEPGSGAVEGLVREADGSPAAGAAVKVALEGAPGGGAEVRATAGPDGRFRIEGLAAGTWRPAVRLPDPPHRGDAAGGRILPTWRSGPPVEVRPGRTETAPLHRGP